MNKIRTTERNKYLNSKDYIISIIKLITLSKTHNKSGNIYDYNQKNGQLARM